MKARKFLYTWISLSVFASILVLAGSASDVFATHHMTTEEKPHYRIAIKTDRPFTLKDSAETWRGLTSELVELLADQIGFRYTYVEVFNMKQLLDSVRAGAVDIGVGAISITSDRETTLDFSHPYFRTTLGMLTRSSAWTMDVILEVGGKILLALGVLAVLMYAIGATMNWWDGGGSIRTNHEGAYWALTTLTTVGYGDFAPHSPRGRAFAAVWMVASMFLVSIFTGAVASYFTVTSLTRAPANPSVLAHSRVGALSGTTAEQALAKLLIPWDSVEDLDQGVEAIESEKLDALVYDKALLDYVVRDRDDLIVRIFGEESEEYGLVFAQGSELRERVNIALVKTLNSDVWRAKVKHYFGRDL